MDETKSYKYDVLVAGVGRTIDVSNLSASGGSGWEYDSATKTITIFSPSDYTITGSTSENKVVVKPKSNTAVPFNIILQDVSIRLSSVAKASALSIEGNSACNVLLYNNSYLYSGDDAAGIYVEVGSSLVLDELLPNRDYRLWVESGERAACIGSNYGTGFGNITIKDIGLFLNVKNSGIGCNYKPSTSITCGMVHISGGHTEIRSTKDSVAGVIGNDVLFNGGILDIILKGDYADGILLPSLSSQDSKMEITGSADIDIKAGSNYGIGIGIRGYYNNSSCTKSILIDGGMVQAYGGKRGVGIGAVGGGTLNKLDIRSGNVSAYGGEGAPGIGGCGEYFWGVNKINEINISDQARVVAKGGVYSSYDIGDSNISDVYSGLYSGVFYSGLYSGLISGVYQGRLSGLFQGEVHSDSARKISCNVKGNYSGEATGKYRGLFVGRFIGYMNPMIYKYRYWNVADASEASQEENS